MGVHLFYFQKYRTLMSLLLPLQDDHSYLLTKIQKQIKTKQKRLNEKNEMKRFECISYKLSNSVFIVEIPNYISLYSAVCLNVIIGYVYQTVFLSYKIPMITYCSKISYRKAEKKDLRQ